MSKFEKDIQIETDLSGSTPDFFMKIGFQSIADVRLSIGHRSLSNRGSGLIRHTGNPTGIRIVNGIPLTDVYDKSKENARIYHNTMEEHLQAMDLRDENGVNLAQFVLVTNGNLGNNYWHVAWQANEKPRLYCLANEPFLDRKYSCFISYTREHPRIDYVTLEDEITFNGEKEQKARPKYPIGFDRGNAIAWCISGQQIVENSRVVPIEEIADQFYDIRHIFDWRDWGPTKEKDIEKLKAIFEGYSKDFRDKVLKELAKGTRRAKYDHHIIGTTYDDDGLVIAHKRGLVEDIAQDLVDKGVDDAIILDQGGSSAVYVSWPYPNGGYLMQNERYRPERISMIGIVLKD